MSPQQSRHVPVGPIPFLSILPPVIPHLLLKPTSHMSVGFSSRDSLNMAPSNPSLRKLFHPPFMSVRLILTGGKRTHKAKTSSASGAPKVDPPTVW